MHATTRRRDWTDGNRRGAVKVRRQVVTALRELRESGMVGMKAMIVE